MQQHRNGWHGEIALHRSTYCWQHRLCKRRSDADSVSSSITVVHLTVFLMHRRKQMTMSSRALTLRAKTAICRCAWCVWLYGNCVPSLFGFLCQLQAACAADGWDIHMIMQPAQSPDVNVLNLGFFDSIQSWQHRRKPHRVHDLIATVSDVFDGNPPETRGKGWATLEVVLQEIMLCKGDNTYTEPQVMQEMSMTNH